MSLSPAAAASPPPATPAPPAASGGTGTASSAAIDPKVAEAARGFEGVFMSMLVNEMFKGTELASQPIYGGLMTQALGDSLADAGGIGLSAMITRQLGGAA